jgi:hypothetical protein
MRPPTPNGPEQASLLNGLGQDILTAENVPQHIQPIRIPIFLRVFGIWLSPAGPLLLVGRNRQHQPIEQKHLTHECVSSAVIFNRECPPDLARHTGIMP